MKVRFSALLLILLQLLQAPKISVHATTLLAFTHTAPSAKRSSLLLSSSFLSPRHLIINNYRESKQQQAATKPTRERRFSLFSSSVSFSAADITSSGIKGNLGKESFFVEKEKEKEREEEEREAALIHQKQLLQDLLNSETNDDEKEKEEENAIPEMSDEEFEEEVGISLRSPPRAVMTALSKWKKKNSSPSLKPQLYKKWIKVFEMNVLKHLQLHAEEKSPKKTFINRALQVLLGGSPLTVSSSSSSSFQQEFEAPSELDVSYGDFPEISQNFKNLISEIRKEEEKQLTLKTFLKRFISRSKFFLPLLLVGSLVKRASMTSLFAAAGIAGKFICPQTNLSPKSFCLSAGALGLHACLGFLTSFCGWKMGGLRHWISLNGLTTGAIVGQWWLASSIYDFSFSHKKEKNEKNEKEEEEESLHLSPDFSEKTPFFSSEFLQKKEMLFDDPELPTAFKDEV